MSTKDPTRAPSLQHFLKHKAGSVEKTAKNLIEAEARPITVSVLGARKYILALLSGSMEYDALVRQAVSDDSASGRAAQEILPLIYAFMLDHDVRGFRPVEEIVFEICPGLKLPIHIYGCAVVDGRLCVLHCQIWKHTSLTADQFSLWWAIVLRAIRQRYPEVTNLSWLELSAVRGNVRQLRVRDQTAARVIPEEELVTFRHHLEEAVAIYKAAPRAKRPPKRPDPHTPSFI